MYRKNNKKKEKLPKNTDIIFLLRFSKIESEIVLAAQLITIIN